MLFNISLKNIIFGIIFFHIFIYIVDEFININNSCSLICSILKSISLFQPFSQVMNKLIWFYNPKFLLFMTKTHTTKITFVFDNVHDLSNNFIYKLFLILKVWYYS